MLSARLQRLVEEDILERRAYQQSPERYEYFLTEKGLDLWPALIALLGWGDRHSPTPDGPPMLIVHKECGGRVSDRGICEGCGERARRPRRPGRRRPGREGGHRERPGARGALALAGQPVGADDTGGDRWRPRRSFRHGTRSSSAASGSSRQGTETIEVVNSSTEEVMGTIPACTAEDADRAVRAAREAFESWSQTSREERAGYLAAIAAGLGERSEEIAATISQELGMPLKLSQMIQAGLPTGQFAAMPGLMEEVAWEEEIGNSRVLREPVGVLGAITPWNYPLNQIAAKVAPALAAGCTVVLKPSEVVPLNAFILAEVIEAAGLPAGVFNLVTGTGPGGRRGDRRPPRRRHGLLHRLDPGRPARLRARLGDGEAGRDGARRQVAERDPRRRRPRAGRSPTASPSASSTRARPAAP